MKHFATAMLGLGIILTAVPAARAEDTVCPSDPSPGTTVNGNIVVPDNMFCTLDGLTVTGNVHVGAGAGLEVSASDDTTAIDGNIRADQCNSVVLDTSAKNAKKGNNAIVVGGNLKIEGCTSQSGYSNKSSRISIGGNFECNDNSGGCFADFGSVTGNLRFTNIGDASLVKNNVGGKVQVNGNTTAEIQDNTIYGNLQCQDNTAITGFRNTVSGHKQGQCANF